jgi:hypothetical protein
MLAWHNLRYSPGICLEKLKENMKRTLSGYPVFELRFEGRGALWMRNMSTDHSVVMFGQIMLCGESIGRSRWPRGMRNRSSAVWLLGSWIRIPLGTWMFVSCVYMLSCVGRGLCDGLITRPEECYRVSNNVWLTSVQRTTRHNYGL